MLAAITFFCGVWVALDKGYGFFSALTWPYILINHLLPKRLEQTPKD